MITKRQTERVPSTSRSQTVLLGFFFIPFPSRELIKPAVVSPISEPTKCAVRNELMNASTPGPGPGTREMVASERILRKH